MSNGAFPRHQAVAMERVVLFTCTLEQLKGSTVSTTWETFADVGGD